MKERYENWKELKPLTAPVPVGTKCVSVITDYGIDAGEIMELIGFSSADKEHGVCQGKICKVAMDWNELALLPSEEPAKVERKIVSGFCDLAGYVHAVCDDGTMWYLGTGSEPKWYKTPPIPQDAV